MKTWPKNKRLISILLIIWFATTLIVGLAPEPLRFDFLVGTSPTGGVPKVLYFFI